MKLKGAGLSALIALCGPSFAEAGPIADAALRAEALQAGGKTVEALDALNSAIDMVWRESPLAFRRVVLVESSEGYGRFTERSDRVFRPDERINIYVEPVGFGYGKAGEAATIDFNVDVAIENMTGQVLGEAKDVFEFSTETYPGRREFGMSLSLGAPYYRPGDYVARVTVRDGNSDKSGTFEVPFTIAPPVFEGDAGSSGAAPAQGGAPNSAGSAPASPAPSAAPGPGGGADSAPAQ